jgi:hypothetical protein
METVSTYLKGRLVAMGTPHLEVYHNNYSLFVIGCFAHCLSHNYSLFVIACFVHCLSHSG